MKKFLTITILLLAVATSASALDKLPINKSISTGRYEVVRIYDGDTFTILIPPNYTVNIRINGIDAPERTQEFGLYSRLCLENLIAGEPVEIHPLEIDIWGRTVATVFNSRGQDIAEEMLKAGMAWHYSAYDNTKKYIQAEQKARFTAEGLWCRPNPINPQDYRRASRSVKLKNR